MTYSLYLKLPDDLRARLNEVAANSGQTPEEWIAAVVQQQLIRRDEGMRYSAPGEDEERQAAGNAVRDARELAGIWSDLDWQRTVEELDLIRHEAPPSEPLDQ